MYDVKASLAMDKPFDGIDLLVGNMPRYSERHSSSTRLYVGRLSSRTRTHDLEDLFSRYGR